MGGAGTAGAAGVAFAPTDIAGPQAWYKADAGTSSVVDGTALSAWNDQSGNARHLTQATGANQPVYKAAIQNGKAVVRFDGSNDFMDAATVNVAQPSTIFVVAKSTVAAAAGHNFVDGTTARQSVYQHTSGVVAMYAGAAEALSGTAWGTAAFHYVSSVFNGASSSMRVDGVAQTLTPASPGTGALTGLRVGAFDAVTGPWQGDGAEILIYNSALSVGNQQSVEAYLAARWGL